MVVYTTIDPPGSTEFGFTIYAIPMPVWGPAVGLGLPIIGKLLGHTQASTTQRYAHLDADPLRRASETIGSRIAAAFDGKGLGSVIQLKR
jgi:hypothetical protein